MELDILSPTSSLDWSWTCPRCGMENEEWGDIFRTRFCINCGEPDTRRPLDPEDRPWGIE